MPVCACVMCGVCVGLYGYSRSRKWCQLFNTRLGLQVRGQGLSPEQQVYCTTETNSDWLKPDEWPISNMLLSSTSLYLFIIRSTFIYSLFSINSPPSPPPSILSLLPIFSALLPSPPPSSLSHSTLLTPLNPPPFIHSLSFPSSILSLPLFPPIFSAPPHTHILSFPLFSFSMVLCSKTVSN